MEYFAFSGGEKTKPIRQATRCRCGIAGLIKANLADPKGVEQKPVDDGRSFIVPHPSSFQPLSRGCQLINRFKRQIDRLIASFFLKERRNAKIILMWGFFLDGAG